MSTVINKVTSNFTTHVASETVFDMFVQAVAVTDEPDDKSVNFDEEDFFPAVNRGSVLAKIQMHYLVNPDPDWVWRKLGFEGIGSGVDLERPIDATGGNSKYSVSAGVKVLALFESCIAHLTDEALQNIRIYGCVEVPQHAH